MKAEERHRLHENELQRLTEHARERSRPFFEQYGTTSLLGLAAVLVVAAIVIWFMKRSSAGSDAGWAELGAVFQSPNPTAEEFANVAEIAKGTPAANWARLYEGEAHLGSGTELLFSDKEGALQDLGDAKTAFEAVLAERGLSPELTVRALYGLGRALEVTSDGDLKPALDRYEQITAGYEDTVYAKLAKDRIDALKSADAKAFYAWFSKQKPVVQDPLQRPTDTGSATGTAPPSTTISPPVDGPALGGTEAPAGAGEAPPTAETPDPTTDAAGADTAAPASEETAEPAAEGGPALTPPADAAAEPTPAADAAAPPQ